MCLFASCRYQRGCRSLVAGLQLSVQSPRDPGIQTETPDSDGEDDVPEEVESVIGEWGPPHLGLQGTWPYLWSLQGGR